jgi:hypothetical protein
MVSITLASFFVCNYTATLKFSAQHGSFEPHIWRSDCQIIETKTLLHSKKIRGAKMITGFQRIAFDRHAIHCHITRVAPAASNKLATSLAPIEHWLVFSILSPNKIGITAVIIVWLKHVLRQSLITFHQIISCWKSRANNKNA